MMFWIFTVVFFVTAGLWIARPFLSKSSLEMNDSDSAISVFRDQLDEVDRDLAAGLITEDQRDQAKQEIERRALNAARHMDGGFTMSHRSLPAVTGIVVIAGAVSFAGYLWTGTPSQPDAPLANRKTEMLEQRAAAGDINSRIELLIERSKDSPESFDTWWTLAVSYASLGDHASAVEAYRKAANLGGDKPGVLSAYAESMTLANGNKVPDAARLVFQQVMARGMDVRARYYLALYKAQNQDFDGALTDWADLARDSDPAAPWMAMVRRDIVNMARFTKQDVTQFLPDATPQEISKSGGSLVPGSSDRVAELERSLAEDAHDYKGWIELAQLRAQIGDADGALAALDEARARFAAAPFVLDRINQAARDLGLDMIAATPDVAGPTHEDMANAADLSDEERDDMIDGMVAGLAAKLEENPDNPEGWIMLVRSYSVLGHSEKAQDYLDEARAHFAENPQVLTRLEAEAASVLSQ